MYSYYCFKFYKKIQMCKKWVSMHKNDSIYSLCVYVYPGIRNEIRQLDSTHSWVSYGLDFETVK